MGKPLVDRCCVCRTIEVDGTLIPKGSYDKSEYDYSDDILSRECFDRVYGEEGKKLLKTRQKIKYDSCKK